MGVIRKQPTVLAMKTNLSTPTPSMPAVQILTEIWTTVKDRPEGPTPVHMKALAVRVQSGTQVPVKLDMVPMLLPDRSINLRKVLALTQHLRLGTLPIEEVERTLARLRRKRMGQATTHLQQMRVTNLMKWTRRGLSSSPEMPEVFPSMSFE